MGVATAMIAMMVASTAIQAVSSVKAGNAAKRVGEKQQDAANSQAELGDYNANVAELQADDAIMRGDLEEQRYRTMIRGVIGQQRAGFAAGNIDVNTGSAVDVQADAAVLGELDALTIKTNARREAWGYKVEAENLRKGAEIRRKEGVNYAEAGRAGQTAGRLNAAGTIVGNSASLLQARYGFGRAR